MRGGGQALRPGGASGRMTPASNTPTGPVTVQYGLIEKVREEPVDFMHLGGGMVHPVYVYGRKRFEFWRDENGEKVGRWTWEYL